MEMSFGDRLRHAWNAFSGNESIERKNLGISYPYRADRPRLSRGNERSIITAVYNRVALDVAAIKIQHVRLDENDRFLEPIMDGLNNCLTLEANIDQTARSFIQDVVISMFDEGSVAIVPVDTTTNPTISGAFDIQSLRVGQIIDWYPQFVKVRVYNEITGNKQDVILPKNTVAIIENPLYAVINEPNSTMQRLIRKLNLLDVIDEQSGAGKLDLIIQLPYVIKTDARRVQAENRRKDIEQQLAGSKYGIAYTDGTERITQLNRSVNNNLMSQIEFLTSMLYSQLGITQTILDGTADEKTMLNYNNRTIEPIISSIVDEMKRKFLTKTARSQHQSILFFKDPFKLVPVNDIAEIADKFTRNEIMTSNEIRQIVGMKPSDDPSADELRNKNLNQSAEQQQEEDGFIEGEENQNEVDFESQIKELEKFSKDLDNLELGLSEDDGELKHYASPYYDPEKAHEYYMKNRELKGRTSTSSLNEDGKKAAQYVKNQITTERKQKIQDHKEKTNSEIESLKEESKTEPASFTDIRNEIATLTQDLKKTKVNDANRSRISEQIKSLRESIRSEKERIQTELTAKIQSLRDEHSTERDRINSEYDEKYASEVEKMNSDQSLQKTKKTKTSSGSRKTSTGKKSSKKSTKSTTKNRRALLPGNVEKF